jgi:hypothetical protein
MSVPEPDVAALAAAAEQEGLQIHLLPGAPVSLENMDQVGIGTREVVTPAENQRRREVARARSIIDDEIEARVEAFREELYAAVEREIGSVLDSVGHVPETRVTPTPAPSMSLVPDEQLERPKGWSCVVAEGLGERPLLRCHHGVSWQEGANAHASGAPREGFACAPCVAGVCAAVRPVEAKGDST